MTWDGYSWNDYAGWQDEEGDLVESWVMPWWFEQPGQNHWIGPNRSAGYWGYSPWHHDRAGLRTPNQVWMGSTRSWFSSAYPVLGPFYSLWTFDPAWMDAWTMQSYQGMW